MARLIDATGRIYALTKTITVVGRSGTDIVLVDSGVAPRQAQVAFADGYYEIQDLAGSTRLNGQLLVRPTPLRNGDRIGAGRRELTVDGVPPPPVDMPPKRRSSGSPLSLAPERASDGNRPPATAASASAALDLVKNRWLELSERRRKERKRGAKLIAVAERQDSQWDDIGSILTRLGAGFAYDPIDLSDSRDRLNEYEVLFINCHAVDDTEAHELAEPIASFMFRGGSVYASDHAGQYLEAACPEAIEFQSVADSGSVRARVVDEGLRTLIGRSIDLTFDLPDWRRVTRVGPAGRTYLAGVDSELFGSAAEQPLLVSFEHGAGTAVFTSFHNSQQATKHQRELLEFLALRPMTAGTMRITAEALSQERLRTIRDSVHKLSAGRRTEPYSFALPRTRNALLIVTPVGEGSTLEVTVFGRDGATIAKDVSEDGPMSVSLPPGPCDLVYEVKALRTPYDNFPFTVSVAIEQ